MWMDYLNGIWKFCFGQSKPNLMRYGKASLGKAFDTGNLYHVDGLLKWDMEILLWPIKAKFNAMGKAFDTGSLYHVDGLLKSDMEILLWPIKAKFNAIQ